MTPDQFLQLLQNHREELEHLVRRTLPVKIGNIAKDHFQDNFRRHGFIDGGIHPWQRTHRQSTAKGANSQYGPLMSGRQHLYGSISYQPGDAQVTIGTDLPYAAIHNDGGDIIVTARMKRYFWAKYRETNGGSWKRKAKNTEADFWKFLALKPVGSVIHIPQRKFIGESRELNDKIEQTILQELEKIFNNTH